MADIKASGIPCRYYAEGHCARGDQCWYKHEIPSSSSTPLLVSGEDSQSPQSRAKRSLSASATSFIPSAAHSGRPEASTSQDIPMYDGRSDKPQSPISMPQAEDLHEQACVVCFDKPTSYGLLESCAHVYCLDCIREWRTAKGKSREQIDNGVLHKCPACRVSSRNIIPSRFWLPQGPQKEAFIASYKEKMGKIPCRNFVASLDDAETDGIPFCPFGKDCFYKHEKPDGTLHVFEHGMAEHLAASRRERDQRRLENHLRTFYDLWRRGELRDEDMDDDSEYDDEDEDNWSDGEDEWDDEEEDSDMESEEGAWGDEADPGLGLGQGLDEDVDDEDDAAYQRDLARAIALSQREAGLETVQQGSGQEQDGSRTQPAPTDGAFRFFATDGVSSHSTRPNHRASHRSANLHDAEVDQEIAFEPPRSP